MTDDTQRAAFLDRIGRALGRGGSPPTPPTPPRVDERLVRLEPANGDLAVRFAAAAEGVGMTVHRCDAGDLGRTVRHALAACDASTAVLCVRDDDVGRAAAAALESGPCRLVDWRDEAGLDRQYDVDAGVTDVEAAVAETGSLVLASGPDHSRGAFLVPPAHVAIVRVDQVVADLVDLWPGPADPASVPASTVLVTGPSKTADIEGILIEGVHGPGRVHVVLVSGAPPG